MVNLNAAEDAALAALEALLKDPRIEGQLPVPTDPVKVDSFLNSERGMRASLRVLEVALDVAKAECLVGDESVSGGAQAGIGEQTQSDLGPAEEAASLAEVEVYAESAADSSAIEAPSSESSPGTQDSLLEGTDSVPDNDTPLDGDKQSPAEPEPVPASGSGEAVVSSVSLEEEQGPDAKGGAADLVPPATEGSQVQNDLSDTEGETDEFESQSPLVAGHMRSEVSGDSANVDSDLAPAPIAHEDTTMNDEDGLDQSCNKASVRPAEPNSPSGFGHDAGMNTRRERLAEYARTPATAPAPNRRPVNPPKLHVELPNSKEGVPYSASPVLTNHGKPITVKVTEVQFPADIGLRLNPESGCVEGTPTEPGDHTCTLVVQHPDSDPPKHLKVDFVFVVNFDTESLWKEVDPSPYAPFQKPHTDSQHRVEREMEIIAASRRGRSHAHNGTFRDDDFKLTIGGDYYLVSVADGAGSAAYSREGSRITVNKFSGSICEALADDGTRQRLIGAIQPWIDDARQEREADESYRNALFELAKVIHAAGKAAIDEVAVAAKANNSDPRSFATTLLSVLLLELQPGGYIVCSFSVGDGAVGMHLDGKTHPLMRPDSGEQAGETRFLTNSVLNDTETFYQRIYVRHFDELGPIFLMTDGVSDPLFSSESQILSERGWDGFYKALAPVLRDSGDDVGEQLIEWLRFHAPSHNDDRTIAMIFPRSDRSEILTYAKDSPDV